jgi:uncharacterized SAM-binding protein YcdF (DUF218 family)
MFLLSPFFYFVVFVLTAAWRWKRRPPKVKVLIVFLIATFFYTTTTPFLFYEVAYRWERVCPVFDTSKFDKESKIKIVVLGSGFNHDKNLPAIGLLGESARGRLLEALRLCELFPNSVLITSGHSASGKTPGAVLLKRAAIELGFDSNRVLTQSKPGNTKEEAHFFANNFYKKGEQIIVVTAAIHMPRALKHFKASGVETVYGAPCDFYTFEENTYSLNNYFPELATWTKIQKLNKEVLGYYFNL